MNVNQLKQSNYLKKEEVDPPVLVTIHSVEQDNVAKEGAPPEMKWVIHFDEFEKSMVLNSTNGQLIAKICGSDESEDWIGKQIVLYHDPGVSFGGKLVGGIRVRAPKNAAGKPVKPPRIVEADVDNDEIPF